MDFEPSKKGESPEILSLHALLSGLKEPENSPFTINSLKAELYRRIKNRLFQRCLRLCQKNRLDDSTAKELTQNTVLKWFDNLPCFEYDTAWSDEKFGNKIASWLNK